MNYDQQCNNIEQSFLANIASSATDVDALLTHASQAIENFAKNFVSSCEFSEKASKVWHVIYSSSLGFILNIANPPSESALKSFHNKLNPVAQSFKSLPFLEDINDILKLVKDGCWLSLSYKLILKGMKCNPIEVSKLIRQENVEIVTQRIRSILPDNDLAYNYGKHVIAITKFKYISTIQRLVQLCAAKSLTIDELDIAMDDFDLVVTMQVVTELKLNEPKVAFNLCHTLLMRMWKDSSISPDIPKVSSDWIYLLHRLHGDNFCTEIRKLLADKSAKPESSSYYIQLMNCLWEMYENNISNSVRDMCTELLLKVVNRLHKEPDPESMKKIEALSRISSFYPNSVISRLCSLAIFFSVPSLDNFLKVADSQIKKKVNDDAMPEGDIALKLQLYLESLVPANLDAEFRKWAWLRDDLIPYLTEDDAEYITNNQDDLKNIEDSASSEDASGHDTSLELPKVVENDDGSKNKSHKKSRKTKEKGVNSRKNGNGKKDGWSCPEENCNKVSNMMENLTKHLRKNHNWSVYECKAFRLSLNVTQRGKWEDYEKNKQKNEKKTEPAKEQTAIIQNGDTASLTTNTQPEPEVSSTVVTNKYKYICPICDRAFKERHTVQAHAEFRHHKRPEEAIEVAKKALEVLNDEEGMEENDYVKDMSHSKGWYFFVDDFLHEELQESSDTPQTMRQDLSTHLFETVKHMYPEAMPNIDYKMSAEYLNSSWDFTGNKQNQIKVTEKDPIDIPETINSVFNTASPTTSIDYTQDYHIHIDPSEYVSPREQSPIILSSSHASESDSNASQLKTVVQKPTHKKISYNKIPAKKKSYTNNNTKKHESTMKVSDTGNKNNTVKIIPTKAHKGMTFEEALNVPQKPKLTKSKTPRKKSTDGATSYKVTKKKPPPTLSKGKHKSVDIITSPTVTKTKMEYTKLIKQAESNNRDNHKLVEADQPPVKKAKITKKKYISPKKSTEKKHTKPSFRKYSKPSSSSNSSEERTDLLGAMLNEMNNNNKILMPLDSDEEAEQPNAFICSICDKILTSEFALVCHKRKVHKSKAKTFIPHEISESLNTKNNKSNNKAPKKGEPVCVNSVGYTAGTSECHTQASNFSKISLKEWNYSPDDGKQFFFDEDIDSFECPFEQCRARFKRYMLLTMHFRFKHSTNANTVIHTLLSYDFDTSVNGDNVADPKSSAFYRKENESVSLMEQDNTSTSSTSSRGQKKRQAAEEAAKKISTPEKYGKRYWAEYQDLARLYKKSVQRNVARALIPEGSVEINNHIAHKLHEDDAKLMLIEEQILSRAEFYCWICQPCHEASFSNFQDFTGHMLYKLQNIDQYAFRCNRPGCLYGFRVQKNLRKHKRSHKTDSGFQYLCHFCPVNEISFPTYESLQRHEKRIHPKLLSRLSKLRRLFCLNKDVEGNQVNEHFLEFGHRSDHDIWKYNEVLATMDDILNAVTEYVDSVSGIEESYHSVIPVAPSMMQNNHDNPFERLKNFLKYDPGNDISVEVEQISYHRDFTTNDIETDVALLIETILDDVEQLEQVEALLNVGVEPLGFSLIPESMAQQDGKKWVAFGKQCELDTCESISNDEVVDLVSDNDADMPLQTETVVLSCVDENGSVIDTTPHTEDNNTISIQEPDIVKADENPKKEAEKYFFAMNVQGNIAVQPFADVTLLDNTTEKESGVTIVEIDSSPTKSSMTTAERSGSDATYSPLKKQNRRKTEKKKPKKRIRSSDVEVIVSKRVRKAVDAALCNNNMQPVVVCKNMEKALLSEYNTVTLAKSTTLDAGTQTIASSKNETDGFKHENASNEKVSTADANTQTTKTANEDVYSPTFLLELLEKTRLTFKVPTSNAKTQTPQNFTELDIDNLEGCSPGVLYEKWQRARKYQHLIMKQFENKFPNTEIYRSMLAMQSLDFSKQKLQLDLNRTNEINQCNALQVMVANNNASKTSNSLVPTNTNTMLMNSKKIQIVRPLKKQTPIPMTTAMHIINNVNSVHENIIPQQTSTILQTVTSVQPRITQTNTTVSTLSTPTTIRVIPPPQSRYLHPQAPVATPQYTTQASIHHVPDPSVLSQHSTSLALMQNTTSTSNSSDYFATMPSTPVHSETADELNDLNLSDFLHEIEVETEESGSSRQLSEHHPNVSQKQKPVKKTSLPSPHSSPEPLTDDMIALDVPVLQRLIAKQVWNSLPKKIPGLPHYLKNSMGDPEAYRHVCEEIAAMIKRARPKIKQWDCKICGENLNSPVGVYVHTLEHEPTEVEEFVRLRYAQLAKQRFIRKREKEKMAKQKVNPVTQTQPGTNNIASKSLVISLSSLPIHPHDVISPSVKIELMESPDRAAKMIHTKAEHGGMEGSIVCRFANCRKKISWSEETRNSAMMLFKKHMLGHTMQEGFIVDKTHVFHSKVQLHQF